MPNQERPARSRITEFDERQFNLMTYVIEEMPQAIRDQAEDFFDPYFRFVTSDLRRLFSEVSPFQLNSIVQQPLLSSQPNLEIRQVCGNQPIGSRGPMQALRQTGLLQPLIDYLQNRELIGIDESRIDRPVFSSQVSTVRSLAFRLRIGTERDEIVSPVLSDVRISMENLEAFDIRTSMTEYLRNLLVALLVIRWAGPESISAVYLHGPLIRAIAPFEGIIFRYDEARRTLEDPSGTFAEDELLSGFHRFCNEDCGLTCRRVRMQRRDERTSERLPLFGQDIFRGVEDPATTALNERDYPGLCLYFYLLRRLYDVCRDGGMVLVSCVETGRTAEGLGIVLPSLLRAALERRIDVSTADQLARAVLDTTFSSTPTDWRMFEAVQRFIRELNLGDAQLLTYVLRDGEYTTPIQIHRYRSKFLNDQRFQFQSVGLDNRFEAVVSAILPEDRYRFLMGYLRTTPLAEPLRIEFFDIPGQDFDFLARLTYFASLPYRSYGMPAILYYADQLARMPKEIVERVAEKIFIDLYRERLGVPDIETILGLRNALYRDFLRR
jgi:hypothetical protein